LDEPTTGLHFEDIQHLLDVLNKISGQGQYRIGDRTP
jgi:excinuclease ABC subunit A